MFLFLLNTKKKFEVRINLACKSQVWHRSRPAKFGLKVPFSVLVLELESRVQAAVPVWSTHTGNLSRFDPSSSL